MIHLPLPRSELRVRDAADDALVIDDPVTGHRTHLGAESAAVFIARGAGHDTAEGLCAAVPHLSPAVIGDRLRQMRDALLLDDTRWRAQRALFGRPASPVPARLHFDPALRHTCVRCGSSCLGVDIGPVDDATLAVVDDHALWTGTEAESAAETVRRRITEQGPVMAFDNVDGACIMLRGGDACALHAAAGPAAKPAGCRQFPYTFTRAPDGVHVGLQFECRSLVDAARAGRAEGAAAHTARLEQLLAEGALVGELPDPVMIGPGIFVPAARYLEWWRVARVAADPGDPGLTALVKPAVALVEARLAELDPDPPWLTDWPGPSTPVDADALRRALPGQVLNACAWLTRDAAERREMVAQEQAELVRKAVLLHLGVVRPPPTHFVPSDPDPWAYALRGALADHRVVLGVDLLQGLGRLRLWLTLSRALARLRAIQGARRPVRAADVTDALAITHRVLRTGLVDGALRSAHAAVRSAVVPGRYRSWMGVPSPGLITAGEVAIG